MKTIINTTANPRTHRGGKKAGLPQNAGKQPNGAGRELPPPDKTDATNAAPPELTEFDGTSIPADWSSEAVRVALERRAAEPLQPGQEYEQAIAACLAAHEARQRRRPGSFTVRGSVLELRRWVWIAVSLAAFRVLLWIVIEVADAAVGTAARVTGW